MATVRPPQAHVLTVTVVPTIAHAVRTPAPAHCARRLLTPHRVEISGIPAVRFTRSPRKAVRTRSRAVTLTNTITSTQSLTLVKNLFRAAFSSIAYIRNLFDEEVRLARAPASRHLPRPIRRPFGVLTSWSITSSPLGNERRTVLRGRNGRWNAVQEACEQRRSGKRRSRHVCPVAGAGRV
jgi:hypothetical protein